MANKTIRPRVGIPRVYNTAICPAILPGEVAEAKIDLEELIRLIQNSPDGRYIDPPIKGWTVEPAPGWHAWFLRLRYRLIGQWFGGKPKLEVSFDLVKEKD